MPIYEFRCNFCHNIFEVECKEKDRINVRCLKCASNDLTPLISKTSFILKGKGWAKDGYNKK